jgi:cobalt-zinc-cadmium efflux system protein
MAHNHSHTSSSARNLRLGVFLSLLILGAEIAGGLLSHSLALLADAGHVLADVFALALSWYGLAQAERPATHHMSFGYHRIGVLVAVVNALSIVAIAIFIIYEAFQRFGQPPQVNSLLMMATALVGLGVNVFVAVRLHREGRANLNIRSAYWHAAGDALASVGVIAGGIIIAVTGLNIVDPIVSIFISLIILTAAWGVFRDAMRVLLEAAPAHVNVKDIIGSISSVSGVKQVHDVHVWSLTPEIHAMSAHVVVDGQAIGRLDAIRQSIEDILGQQFTIRHTTLQMECLGCGENEPLCRMCVDPDHEPNPGKLAQPNS